MARPRTTPDRRSLAVAIGAAVVAAAVVAGVAAGPVAAQEAPTEQVTVSLAADGDATFTTRYTYDLTDEADRQSFAAIEAEPDAHTTRYAARLRGIADQVAAEEGREMTVRDPALSTDRVGDVGVVELSVTWTNLAATEGDRLVVSSPFDDGFQPDRPLVVVAPDGYAIEETAVSPSDQSDASARWAADGELAGFTATAAPTGDELASPLAVPVTALLLAAGGLTARRRSIAA